ncbi:hypothetical protein [Desulfonatronum parangueonense]
METNSKQNCSTLENSKQNSEHYEEVIKKQYINVEQFRLRQDFNSMSGVKKLLTTVPVRKPNRQDFVRVHPDNDMKLQTAVIELKEDREHYLVNPDILHEIPGETVPKQIVTAVNRQGVVFLWPIRLPGEDGRLDNYNQSALEASEMAEVKWIRLAANLSLGAYEVFEALGNIPDPVWPEISFTELVNIAFKGRIIDKVDHPIIQRLLGIS